MTSVEHPSRSFGPRTRRVRVGRSSLLEAFLIRAGAIKPHSVWVSATAKSPGLRLTLPVSVSEEDEWKREMAWST